MAENFFLTALLFLFSLAVYPYLVFSAQAGPEEIIIGYPSRSMTELPNYLAIRKGFFREERLEPKFVQARSNILVAALASESMDYVTSMTTSIGGILGGVPAKIVMGITRNNPDFLMVKSDIRSIQELKGKKLAVSGFGGASHQRLLMILRKAGLDPNNDVNILSVGEARLRLEQLRLGAIDATVLTAPHNFVAERVGFRSLGSSKDILAFPAVGIATLERKLKEKPEQVRRAIRSVLKGMKYLKEHREEAVTMAMEWLSLDRDLAERSYDVMLPNYSIDGAIDPAALRASIDLIGQRRGGGVSRKNFSVTDIADFSLLEEVRRGPDQK